MSGLVKPPIGLIDLSHPLAINSPSLWPMWDDGGDRVGDVIGDKHGALVNGALWVAAHDGPGIYCDGGNDRINMGDAVPHTGSGTVIIAFNSVSIQSQDEGLISNRTAGNSRWLQLTVRDTGYFWGITGSGGVEFLRANFEESGVPIILIGTWESGIALRLFKNGVLIGEDTSVGDLTATDTDDCMIGAYFDLSAGRSHNATFSYAQFLTRPLTAGEAAKVSADIYAAIRIPDSLPLWVAATSGGGDIALPATSDFTVESGSLDGDKLSQTDQHWALGEGAGLSESSGVVVGDATTDWDVEYVTDMPDTTDITATIEVVSGNTMRVMARYDQGATTYYCAQIKADGKLELRRVDGDSTSPTVLGSEGSAVSASDTIAVRCFGTSIYALINGVVDIGPITDANYATGKAAIGIFEQTGTLDDFSATVFVPAAGGGFTEHYYRLLLAGVSR